jgi:carbon-monoxide dehydrogenase large subunit
MPEGTVNQGIGASVRRKEDKRFLIGKGNYTDDINRAGQLHVFFLRSPVAFADIVSIDKQKAEKASGVAAILTGEDVAADNLGGPICGWAPTNKDGSAPSEPPHPILANGRVRYVGDHVAAVFAETLEQAMSAAELIDVTYSEMPAITDLKTAMDSPQIHDDMENNTYFDWELGDEAATNDAFDKAATIVNVDIRNNRVIPNAMEPRAAVADYDAGDGRYTLFTTSQNPQLTRLVIGAFMLNIPESKFRVVAPDVGGGFGSKIYVYPEEAVCVWASKKLGRAVKWTADRTQAFLGDAHGRDHISEVKLALDKNNRIT